MRGTLKMIGAALVAALFLVEATRVRANAAGTRYLKGRTITSSATGGIPGSNDALNIPASITAAGNTAWVDASELEQLLLSFTITGFTGGTAPSITFIVETADSAQGNVRALGTNVVLSGAGTQRGSFPGVDVYYRVRWTLAGAPTSVNGVAVSGEGK